MNDTESVLDDSILAFCFANFVTHSSLKRNINESHEPSSRLILWLKVSKALLLAQLR